MKKTLTLILSLGCFAAGFVQADTEVVQADFSVTDFSNYKGISEGGWTLNAASTVTAGESLVFTDDLLYVAYKGDSIHHNNITFTFVLDGLSANSGYNALYTLHTHDSKSGGNVIGLCLDKDNSSYLTGIAQNQQWDNDQNKDIEYPEGKFILTVQHTNQDYTLVYLNGELAAKISGLRYSGDSHTMKQLNFGGNSTGGNGVNVTLEGLYIHNQKLTADEIKTFVGSLPIPEPTTATLSLLALAGLAARRRRR